MKFSTPLVTGKLIKRYKRFLADVTLEDGQVVTAHCANTGSMKTCGSPGDQILLSYNPSPKRKLAYSWELTEIPEGYIGINTMHPNRVVEEAVREGMIPELKGYRSIKREQKYGEKSKIDLLLEDSEKDPRKCYVEIKNVTLKSGEEVAFPDAVTSRGLKHLKELSQMVTEGHRAVLLFFVNRPDAESMTIASDIDPAYSKGMEEAIEAGLEVLAYQAKTDREEMLIGDRITFRNCH